MADFNIERAQEFQSGIISRVREMERILDAEVIRYYTDDRVDNEADYYENLRGLRNYLRGAAQRLDGMLVDIDSRL